MVKNEIKKLIEEIRSLRKELSVEKQEDEIQEKMERAVEVLIEMVEMLSKEYMRRIDDLTDEIYSGNELSVVVRKIEQELDEVTKKYVEAVKHEVERTISRINRLANKH